jgi:GNAT superfamily N-acetyltransferase
MIFHLFEFRLPVNLLVKDILNPIINMIKFDKKFNTNDPMNIRKANPSDMPSVLRLIKELAKFEKEAESVEVTVDNLVDDGFKKNPAFKVFIAEEEGRIVGMALFYERYSTWKGKSLHLEDLIVEERYRSKGIGKALYTKVLKYAYKFNFKRVAWEVLDWNTPAINFYESTGAKIMKGWRVVHMNEVSLSQFTQNINQNN